MICVKCNKEFKYKKNYENHLILVHDIRNNIVIKPKLKLKNEISDMEIPNTIKLDVKKSNINKSKNIKEIIKANFKCELCDKSFKQHSSIRRHLDNNSCKSQKLTKEIIFDKMQEQLKSIHNEVSNLSNQIKTEVGNLSNQIKTTKPPNINNLNMSIHINSKSDYLDMLSDRMGPQKALEFIKDCGLSGISGDVKLLMKVYYDGIDVKELPIRFHDTKRLKLSYLGDNGVIIKEHNGEGLSNKLGINIQNTYLHGAKELNDKDPLPQYDMEQWIIHTSNLNDPFTRKKILRQLMIEAGVWQF